MKMADEKSKYPKKRRYAAGYHVITTLEQEGIGQPWKRKVAYTENDQYIGDPKDAKTLYAKGILPECIPGKDVCSIGFSEKDQMWYGWSHRALAGFKIGDEVKRGDTAYVPRDLEDFKVDAVQFWHDEHRAWTRVSDNQPDEGGLWIEWEYSESVPNRRFRHTKGRVFHNFPKEWGRGEWKAETLEDTKQMAIDFANSVA